jgi:flagellar biosynthetic protein FliP
MTAFTATLVRRPLRRLRARLLPVVLLGVLALLLAGCVPGEIGGQAVPRVTVGVDQAQGPQETVTSLQILILLTILSLAPAFLIMVTAFTRIIIVLSLIRNAIGVPQLPPNQVLLGLALFLTFFVMAPVWQQVQTNALAPFTAGQISQEEAFARAEQPVRQFMLRQVREKDLALFVYLARIEQPRTVDDVPTYVVVPAFIISELKTAFQMGFVIFIPFLVIDMVVSTILMSMGMMMLPPVLISLPFKILLFVMVDGWYLLTRALVLSFN